MSETEAITHERYKRLQETVRGFIAAISSHRVPPEISAEECWCASYGTHYEVCENDPRLFHLLQLLDEDNGGQQAPHEERDR